MEERVEARSLSAINFLAANPPQYPLNPTEEPRESLPLYISRVPGSRDVILSPFKPRRKNVTGDDISNALYYVHLDAHSDERLVAPTVPNSHGLDSPRSSVDSSHNSAAIHRKPLPPGAKLSHLQTSVSEGDVLLRHARSPVDPPQRPDDAPSLPPRPLQQPDDAPLLPPRPVQQRPPQASASIPRKPLGPRQMGQPRSMPGQNAYTQSKPPPQQRSTELPSPSSLGTEPALVENRQFVATQAHLGANPTASPAHERAQETPFAPFCLSLIRRDPSSGHQWNVGKVTSLQPAPARNNAVQDEDEPSPQNMRHPQGQPTINVHIETSGYAKFRGMPTRRSVEAFRPGSSSSLPQNFGAAALGILDDNRGSPPAHQPKHVEEGFNRQVAMSYTKSWAANVRDAFKRSSRSHSTVTEDDDAAVPLPPQAPFLRTHSRQDSGSSVLSGDSAKSNYSSEHSGRLPDEQPAIITQGGPGLKARGYFFTSPWDGRCEFRTGRGGRSLRCELASPPASSGFNPLVASSQGGDRAQHGRSRQGSLTRTFGQGDGVPVSELRFNLPGRDRFKKKTRHGNVTDFHGRLDKLLGLGEEDSGEDDAGDDDIKAFYMSLGREKAGGGNRGKRAKLGKLIIHDEGLKMLDLVVAANMGVWWSTWEKSV